MQPFRSNVIGLYRKKSETFDDTLAKVTEAMEKIKENYPRLESAAGLEHLFSQGYAGMEKHLAESAEMDKKNNVPFPLLSNFGILNAYHFGELIMIKGFISSPIIYLPGFMLGTSTFNGEITLSIGYCGEENTKGINRFLDLDAYVAELPKYGSINV